MSIGPSGITGSFAGSPLAQSQGSEIERAQQETANQARQTDSAKQAEKSAGIGQTEEEQEAGERDADGRRLWEDTRPAPEDATQEDEPADRQSKDPTGERGNHLDLTG